MQRTDFGAMHCSMARALDILGEPWTPLILRDLLIGFSQFDELKEDLGISTNVLSDRLHRLVDHGVVERAPYGTHPRRFEYRLTAKGRDAVPILLALVAWGDRWESRRTPTEIVHERCGEAMTPVAHCSACGEPVDLDELHYRRGPGSRRGPGTRLLPSRLEPAAPATGRPSGRTKRRQGS
jgi:DNA-binding HxlR family transcriptional regulator